MAPEKCRDKRRRRPIDIEKSSDGLVMLGSRVRAGNEVSLFEA
jgi:hypothetical protein